jgi:PAS domain-containing protein
VTEAPLQGDGHLREVVNAIPAPLYVVDRDICILDLNRAAREFLRVPDDLELHRLCGDVLSCVNALEGEEECGKGTECPDCQIRSAIESAFADTPVVRRWTRMKLFLDRRVQLFDLLVSATPFTYDGRALCLLVIEDVGELTELRRLIPICSNCGKARSDDQYWQSVNEYLRKHTAVQFTHGICPECEQKLYPEGESGK